MKILVIEDEKILADSLKLMLSSKGFETEAVYDGETGEQYAMLNIYDLIILDIMLPKQNDYQIAKHIREKHITVARLDNNKSIIRSDVIDYSKLINDCILPFEPLFYEKNMELSTDIDDNIKAEGDKDKLRQVITILLDNALKYYDPANSVNMLLKRQTSHCILKISGKGIHLSKADCKNIFKRFYRVDQARNDGHSYGLGLSIAESIINEHHGRIWAESVNGYNIFYVLLTAE